MVERGEATAEDIDQAMKLGAGYRKYLLLRAIMDQHRVCFADPSCVWRLTNCSDGREYLQCPQASQRDHALNCHDTSPISHSSSSISSVSVGLL
jgi:hypothetical protein